MYVQIKVLFFWKGVHRMGQCKSQELLLKAVKSSTRFCKLWVLGTFPKTQCHIGSGVRVHNTIYNVVTSLKIFIKKWVSQSCKSYPSIFPLMRVVCLLQQQTNCMSLPGGILLKIWSTYYCSVNGARVVKSHNNLYVIQHTTEVYTRVFVWGLFSYRN